MGQRNWAEPGKTRKKIYNRLSPERNQVSVRPELQASGTNVDTAHADAGALPGSHPGRAPREGKGTSMRIKGFLLFVTATTAVAGFLYGYDTGIISSALLSISAQFHLEHTMQEVVASAILVGAIAGALVCGWAFEKLGRRKMILVL